MEKRKEKRLKKRILSSLEEKPAIIVDISKGGIQISMNSTPKNQEVSIKLKVGNKVINLQGDIRWINRTVASQNTNNVGIAIRNAPEEYMKLLKSHP